ncbi:hypothetical protein CQW39_04750 [Streptomyces griseofuscus]|uniref:hypothetical protein n=1 Tax=Streptomyces griseofuscus TaxID=146922 RepID=UPI000F64F6D1|nr:hypothetical protein [Streptomyces griseofuscus]RRQ81119.1 hypothetical protein CQW39_04750 [Streptomyces griseofuscus]
MRVTRMVAALTAAVTATLGLSLATAGSAAAAGGGSWHAYGNTNPITSSSSTWRCAGTVPVATDVSAQVCAIRSSGGGAVQGAVIVRNNRSSLYSVQAAMDLATPSASLGAWACPSSGVGATSWSVCFGPTLSQSGPVNSVGEANNVNLGMSPNV